MEKREAILAAVLAGKTNKEIQETVGVSRKTIFNVKCDLRERGILQRKFYGAYCKSSNFRLLTISNFRDV